MCRLLGFASPSPTTVRDVLGHDEIAVFQDMARLHRDGWGTAWLTAGAGSTVADEHSAAPGPESLPDPIGSDAVGDTGSAAQADAARQAGPAGRTDPNPQTGGAHRSHRTGLGDDELTRILVQHSATARIVHLRMATDGMVCSPENTHPFTAGDLSFAHNGALKPLGRIDRHIDQRLRNELAGTTDSERYFAAIRSRIVAGVPLLEAVRSTVAALREDFPTASMNALLLSPTHLIAVHASEGAPIPHHDFDASGIADEMLPRHHRDAYYLMRVRRLAHGAVAFASSGLDIAGWDPLPPESVAAVDLRTLELSVHSFDGTPAAGRKVA